MPLDERGQYVPPKLRGDGVFYSLTWVDPIGTWWIAPLGSETPNPDRAMPPEWIEIVRKKREDMI
jgi:hypothetical protein